MPACYIALGTTRSDFSRTFERALSELTATTGSSLVACSSIYQTDPVGGATSLGFANAAACIKTQLSPVRLLASMQRVEADLGRVRTKRWGSREIDLDLLLYGETVLHTTDLTVPHPRLWYRRFVLDPLAEIAAECVHPERQATIATLRARLLPRPLVCGLWAGSEELRMQIVEFVRAQFPEVAWADSTAGTAAITTGVTTAATAESGATNSDPAILFDLGTVRVGKNNASVQPSLPETWRCRLLDISAEPTDPLTTVRDVLNSALGTSRD